MNKYPLFFPLDPLCWRLLVLIHHEINKEPTKLKARLGYFALLWQSMTLVNRRLVFKSLISWLEPSNLNNKVRSKVCH